MNIRASHRTCFHNHLIYHHIYRPPLVLFNLFIMFFYHNFYLFFLLLAVSFRHGFFLPAFLFKNTYRVFSDFNSRFYTHFSLLYTPISFRFVFFCLLSLQKTHAACFPTSILAFIHTFPFSTCQSASGLCFSACFLNMCFKHIFFPLSSYS